MSGYTLSWHADAIDDLIRLAFTLDARTLKAVQDNVPLLRDDPRPMTARQLPDLPDAWALPIGSVMVEYEIIADSVIRILGVRPQD
jgi:ParE-like toxin of type II ParDE toxin-antitoxin system